MSCGGHVIGLLRVEQWVLELIRKCTKHVAIQEWNLLTRKILSTLGDSSALLQFALIFTPFLPHSTRIHHSSELWAARD